MVATDRADINKQKFLGGGVALICNSAEGPETKKFENLLVILTSILISTKGKR